VDTEISTKFEDWIERDLLEVERNDIDQVTLEDYSIDERTGRIDMRDRILLTKKDGSWEMDRAAADAVDQAKVSALLAALDELSIVGVRPKPEGLSQSLKQLDEGLRITQADLMSLQKRGFYLAHDGRLLSNEGELRVRTAAGITYTLRFGEILRGQGEEISVGGAEESTTGPGENRYLFITADFQAKPAAAGEEGADEAKKKNETAAARLNTRFADWYYVISASSFDKVHVRRKDLLRKKA
jgi:hypothetical protein